MNAFRHNYILPLVQTLTNVIFFPTIWQGLANCGELMREGMEDVAKAHLCLDSMIFFSWQRSGHQSKGD